jgi:tRNA-binding protein
MKTITYEEFEKVNLRSGTIVKAEEFSRARKSAFKVWVDFGSEIGVLQTSAQVTARLHHRNFDWTSNY